MISPKEVWHLNHSQLQTLLESRQLKPAGDTIHFYAPSFTYYKTQHFQSKKNVFPTVSITADKCALNCRHCGAILLKTMHGATTPEALFSLAEKLKCDGAEGVLVSGGCLPNGSVPLGGFSAVLGRLKRELGLKVLVHTGLVDEGEAATLGEAGVDAALIDVVGSDLTIKRIFHLDAEAGDYAESLRLLQAAGVAVVPHVIVGLDDGELSGEFHALEFIKENCTPSAVVVIAFMPIRGTEMASSAAPKPLDVAKVVAAARVMFPKTALALGCMRPKGKHRAQTEVFALKAGVDAVAFPSQEAVAYAGASGGKVTFSQLCCAQVAHDLDP